MSTIILQTGVSKNNEQGQLEYEYVPVEVEDGINIWQLMNELEAIYKLNTRNRRSIDVNQKMYIAQY